MGIEHQEVKNMIIELSKYGRPYIIINAEVIKNGVHVWFEIFFFIQVDNPARKANPLFNTRSSFVNKSLIYKKACNEVVGKTTWTNLIILPM